MGVYPSDIASSKPVNKDIIVYSIRKDKTKEYYIRRYYEHQGIISLISENKSSEIVYVKSIDDIYLHGKVIAYTSSLE
jgi:hypothetical protein